MTKPTTEDLKELLGKVTPSPWWTDAKYDGAEKGCAIVAARTDCGTLPGNPTRGMVAWSSALLNTEARRCEANATLIALAPTLAAEVVRLREALTRRAIQDIERLVEWLNEDEDNAELLLSSLTPEQIASARQAISQK